jgi:dienelactone hydrolase
MGLIGFSIGAIVAALIPPHDPRISSTVLVMGGGRPGEILAYCNGKAQKTRDAVTERLGWTVDEYRERLTHIFRDLDPVNYGAMYDPGRVLIIDAERDECIPRSAQDDLWEAMGRPQRISLPYSHRVAFLAMTPLGGNFMREEIWEFLNRTLRLNSPGTR